MDKKIQLDQTIQYLRKKGIERPEIGVVLGTGLGGLVSSIEIREEISYGEIPNFPKVTMASHSGRLYYGEISGKSILLMSGRFHLYEGYSPWEVSYGIRVMHGLGIHRLFLSNAAGGINPGFQKGNLMLIQDHLNLQGASPLAFQGATAFGNIFVDMSQPYSNKLNTKLIKIAKDQGIDLQKGVYASVLGPQLETKAEYRMLQILEVDAVGMSTVPEVIVANQLQLPLCCISVITDLCNPKNLKPVDIEEIMEIASQAQPKLNTLFRKLIESVETNKSISVI